MQDDIIVSICNEAILQAGNSYTITSLADNSQLAELCSRLWDTTVEEMYSEHAWAFRKVKYQLDLLSIRDDENIYAIPDSSLRILGFYRDKGCQVEEHDASVHADLDGVAKVFSPRLPLFVEFLCDSTSLDKISPWLKNCLIFLLASKIATSQGKDDTKILQKYTMWLDKAEENNASEDRCVHTYDDKFIDCR